MGKKKLSDSELNSYFKDQNRRKKKKIFSTKNKRLWWIGSGVLVFLFAIFFIYIISGLPSLEELENPTPQLASKVFTVDGELLGQFYVENRIETSIDSLPKYVTNALIATEDRKFYHHWGVDVSRFVKAMIKNIFTFSREGASTITQQLAKNLYKLKSKNENDFETMVRKIREWITAVQIEKTYTKDEILEMYYNVSYFGRSAYGIEAASKVYFGKDAKDLTLPEAALFVALLKSPENYDPIKRKQNALERRNLVMHNMVVTGMLGEQEYEKLKQEPIILKSKRIGGSVSEAPYFMEYIRQKLEAMSGKYGYNLYRDGLNIYVSIDSRMQKIANEAAEEHLAQYQKLFDKNWSWKKNKDLLVSLIDRAIKNNDSYRNAVGREEKAKIYNSLKNNQTFVDSVKKEATKIEVGFVVIDPTNGQIRAMVGGENQEFGRGLNHVTGIRRQPGSAFKPFVYTTAVDNGYYPAYTLLNQKFNYNGWSPSNFEDDYGGYMTLRDALAYSVNVIAGRMTISDIAPPIQVIKYAKKMGIESHLDPYPSLALGTCEVSPLELTSAYGTFANHGVHIDPIAILKIEDRNGILIDQFTPEFTEAISPQTASIMTSMMESVIDYGTGARVRQYFHRPAAGKTGTTQEYSDAWFIGFTPQLVGGVWVGFDDHRVKFTSSYGQGAHAALPIWAKFMQDTYKKIDMPLEYFQMAPGIDTVQFCKETMNLGDPKIATQYCPEKVSDIINVKYTPQTCNIHTGIKKVTPEDRRGDTGW
jgi:penicillin-binding protein 1A